MFGYSDLIVDPRNFVLMRDAGCPVTADVTHALQQPVSHPPLIPVSQPLTCEMDRSLFWFPSRYLARLRVLSDGQYRLLVPKSINE